MNGISLKETILEDCNIINEKLNCIFQNADKDYISLFDSMNYSLLSGGKRIRPCITLEICKMLNGNQKKALTLGSAIELVHTYSLIHDDLPCMDNDDFRRGKLTNHKKFGEATALLAGDGLLTYAFTLISEDINLSSDEKAKAISLLAKNAGSFGMIGGQQMDMDGEKKKLSYEEYKKMCSLKTGALIKTAALFGCISSNCDEDVYKTIEKYSENIGLLFQLVDDLLDEGEEPDKSTFLNYMTKSEASEYILRIENESIEMIKDLDKNEFFGEFTHYLANRKS